MPNTDLPNGLRITPKVVRNTITYPANAPAPQDLAGDLPFGQKPVVGLLMRVQFRAAVTVAATAVLPDGPLGIIENVKIVGAHKRKGNITLVDAPLAKLDARNRIVLGCTAFNVGQALATGVANYDVDATTFVPLSLALELRAQNQQAMSLLNPADYTSVSLSATWGNGADIFEGGTVAIQGIGGVGSAVASFHVLEADLGGVPVMPFIPRFTDTLLPASTIAATGTNLSIVQQLALGRVYKDLLIKTFIPNAGSPGNSALTLEDGNVVSKIYVVRDGETTMAEVGWSAQQYFEENVSKNAVDHETGYCLIDFARGDMNAALDVRQWGKPNQPQRLSLNGDLTSTANAQLSYLACTVESAA